MARDFSGDNGNYLSITEDASVDVTGTALTVACWAFAETLATTKAFLGKTSGSGANQIQYTMICDASAAYIRVGDATSFDQAAAAGFGTAAWHHVAGVKNGTGASALQAYVDGAAGSATASNRTIQNLSDALLIGRNLSGGIDNFDGRLAEVGIWNVALTAGEITALSKGVSPLLVRPQSLLGYWPLLGNVSAEPNLRAGNGAVIVGTMPKGVHPRVLMPRAAIYLP